jgi:hypothetical protein
MGIAPTSQPYLMPMFSSRTITPMFTMGYPLIPYPTFISEHHQWSYFQPYLQIVKHLVIVNGY